MNSYIYHEYSMTWFVLFYETWILKYMSLKQHFQAQRKGNIWFWQMFILETNCILLLVHHISIQLPWYRLIFINPVSCLHGSSHVPSLSISHLSHYLQHLARSLIHSKSLINIQEIELNWKIWNYKWCRTSLKIFYLFVLVIKILSCSWKSHFITERTFLPMNHLKCLCLSFHSINALEVFHFII